MNNDSKNSIREVAYKHVEKIIFIAGILHVLIFFFEDLSHLAFGVPTVIRVLASMVLPLIVIILMVSYLSKSLREHSPLDALVRVKNYVLISLGVNFVILSTYARIYYRLDAVDTADLSKADALYFSIVTFTTLGYGDFKPTEQYRLLAASEAFLGYIVLGLMVGGMVGLISNINKQKVDEQ